MKQAYVKVILSTLLVVLITHHYSHLSDFNNGNYRLKSQSTDKCYRQQNVIQPNIYPAIQHTLAEREYHIGYDSLKHAFQSPNRKQNLRTHYTSGQLKIGKRRSEQSKAFLTLTTDGVYADNKLIFKPLRNANVQTNANKATIGHLDYSEEFINNKNGVRQNFIIKHAPKTTDKIQVRLISDGMEIKSHTDSTITFISEENDLLTYSGLKCWDASSKPLFASMKTKGKTIILDVEVSDAVFPVTIDPIIANGDPSNASETLASNQSYSGYGASVSSAGDVNNDGFADVVVGAPFYDLGEDGEGASFIFLGSPNGIDVSDPIILQINQSEANFGHSVASAGDLNNDGFGDIVIGAPFFDHEDQNEGAAFIYLGKTDGISLAPQTQVEGNLPEAHMGFVVANAGNVDGDVYGDLIVVAPGWQDIESSEGAAFVFHGSQQGLDQSPKIVLEGNKEIAMTMSATGGGDVNNDGYDDVIVGTIGYTNGELFEGAATVYYGSSTGISLNGKTVLEGNQLFSAMGVSVEGVGDINGDGFDDIIVGASEYANGESGEGVVFSFNGSSTGINLTPSVMLEKDQADADFGHSVTGLGDLNGDGYNDIAVGAFHFDNNESDEGAAFIFFGSPEGLKPTDLMFESNQAGSLMGASVKNAGDVNGDGTSDLIIGAQGFGQGSQGAAFVFHEWNAALPVKLVGFQARTLENNISLTWSTSQEVNSDYFEIQKATSQSRWTAIGAITSSFNAVDIQHYSFLDSNPFAGENIYRLKIFDKDGTYSFSSIRSVHFLKSLPSVSVIYPNPASQIVKINSNASSLSFFNLNGKQVLTVNSPKSGEEIDVSKLHPGIYSTLIRYPNGSSGTGKVLIE